MSGSYLKKLIFILLLTLPLLCNGTNSSLKAALNQAELVFEGQVVDVQYRLANLSESASELPYTFVTYQVNRFLKGRAEGLLTLRFLGGPKDDEHFVSIPGLPRFDLGDHDILLVQGNQRSTCPLVGCDRGRYRIINGLVVNEYGQTIELSPSGEIVFGEKVKLDDISTHTMGKFSFVDEQTESLSGELTAPENLNAPSSGIRPDPAGFSAFIEDQVLQSHSPEELEETAEFNNADPDAPIQDEIMKTAFSKAVAPPPDEDVDYDSNPMEESYRQEMEELKKYKANKAKTKPQHAAALEAVSIEKVKMPNLPLPSSQQKTESPQQGSAWKWTIFLFIAAIAIFVYKRNKSKR